MDSCGQPVLQANIRPGRAAQFGPMAAAWVGSDRQKLRPERAA